ncbi:MAG: hypothetical protein IKI63_00705, partial [Clostridia bacterium]|nr:hypothetical protein [Clostridia bacterium]
LSRTAPSAERSAEEIAGNAPTDDQTDDLLQELTEESAALPEESAAEGLTEAPVAEEAQEP